MTASVGNHDYCTPRLEEINIIFRSRKFSIHKIVHWNQATTHIQKSVISVPSNSDQSSNVYSNS